MKSLLIWSAKDSTIKENARTCSINHFYNFKTEKEVTKLIRNLYEKKYFKPEIKPIIRNLQHELYQFVNKQAKSAKLAASIKWKLEGEKCFKTFFKVLERKNMQDLNLY